MDELIECGGINEGFVFIEIVFFVLIGCINVIGYKCVVKMGVDIGDLDFVMEVDFDCCGVFLMEEVEVLFKVICFFVIFKGSVIVEEF